MSFPYPCPFLWMLSLSFHARFRSIYRLFTTNGLSGNSSSSNSSASTTKSTLPWPRWNASVKCTGWLENVVTAQGAGRWLADREHVSLILAPKLCFKSQTTAATTEPVLALQKLKEYTNHLNKLNWWQCAKLQSCLLKLTVFSEWINASD